jgi:hypothetical protein
MVLEHELMVQYKRNLTWLSIRFVFGKFHGQALAGQSTRPIGERVQGSHGAVR